MSEWDEGMTLPPLDEFGRAVADLKAIWLDASTAFANNDRVSTRARNQWNALANDLIAFCSIFTAVHQEVVAIWTWDAEQVSREPRIPGDEWDSKQGLPGAARLRQWHDQWVAELGGDEGVRLYWERQKRRMAISAAASARLAAAYKAMFFFVRAYQDGAYRVILQLLGTRGEGVSMSQAAKNPKNPVAVVLAERAPTYMPWFQAWRALRDSIKTGRHHSMRGPQWNVGVSFVDEVPQLAGFQAVDITVRLSQIVIALDQSLSVSRAALDLAIH